MKHKARPGDTRDGGKGVIVPPGERLIVVVRAEGKEGEGEILWFRKVRNGSEQLYDTSES